jgi:hypothetical protein
VPLASVGMSPDVLVMLPGVKEPFVVSNLTLCAATPGLMSPRLECSTRRQPRVHATRRGFTMVHCQLGEDDLDGPRRDDGLSSIDVDRHEHVLGVVVLLRNVGPVRWHQATSTM